MLTLLRLPFFCDEERCWLFGLYDSAGGFVAGEEGDGFGIVVFVGVFGWNFRKMAVHVFIIIIMNT